MKHLILLEYTGDFEYFLDKYIAKYKNITELVEKVDNSKIITLNNYINTDVLITEERLKKALKQKAQKQCFFVLFVFATDFLPLHKYHFSSPPCRRCSAEKLYLQRIYVVVDCEGTILLL